MLVVLLLANCLGVSRSKAVIAAAAQLKAQSVLDANPVSRPPALVNPDGTPLHPAVDEKNIYEISVKDGEEIAEFEETAATQKLLEKENMAKAMSDFQKFFYYPNLTSAQVIEDAEDADLGLPPKDRSLTDSEKQKRVQEETERVQKFHAEIRSFIYDATPDELKNMRTNLTLAIAVHGRLGEYIIGLSSAEQLYFKKIIEYNIQSRTLVIDAMTAGGIKQ